MALQLPRTELEPHVILRLLARRRRELLSHLGDHFSRESAPEASLEHAGHTLVLPLHGLCVVDSTHHAAVYTAPPCRSHEGRRPILESHKLLRPPPLTLLLPPDAGLHARQGVLDHPLLPPRDEPPSG